VTPVDPVGPVAPVIPAGPVAPLGPLAGSAGVEPCAAIADGVAAAASTTAPSAMARALMRETLNDPLPATK
jgi:hypothetical protein